MILALDFDRVLHDTDNPKPGRRMGPPMAGALDAVRRMTKSHEVFVHTCMAQNAAGEKAVRDWLSYYGFPEMEIVAKPTADLYVDDKAWTFDITDANSLHEWGELVARTLQ